jgi:hypothetical protein
MTKFIDLTGIRIHLDDINIHCSKHGIIARHSHLRRRGPFRVNCANIPCHWRSDPLPDEVVEYIRKSIVALGTPRDSISLSAILEKTEMNKNDVFPPAYFKAGNLPYPITVEIASAEMEAMKDFKGANVRKLVLSFADETRRFIVNRTNFDIVADLHGPDTKTWIGKSITLSADKTRVQGRIVDTVRAGSAN